MKSLPRPASLPCGAQPASLLARLWAARRPPPSTRYSTRDGMQVEIKWPLGEYELKHGQARYRIIFAPRGVKQGVKIWVKGKGKKGKKAWREEEGVTDVAIEKLHKKATKATKQPTYREMALLVSRAEK